MFKKLAVVLTALAAAFIGIYSKFFKKSADDEIYRSEEIYGGDADDTDDTDVNGYSRSAVFISLIDIKNSGVRFGAAVDKTDGSGVTIGRGRSCGIVIGYNSTVSVKHCRIFYYDGILFVEDLDSTNKTGLNGRQVFEPQRIRSGDILTMGDLKMRVVFNE